jgi:YVTN family beta-propeller protein
LRVTADDLDQLKVGVQPDGSIVVPTNQVLTPAGVQITFPGRPVDLAFADDGKTLLVKNKNDLVFIDTASNKIAQVLALPNKAGFSVVGLAVHGTSVYATDAGDDVRVAERGRNGKYAWTKSLTLLKPRDGKAAYPAGVLVHPGGDYLWVTSTRGNSIQLISTTRGSVEALIKVGVAPYGLVATADGLFVSNWGGDPPGKDNPQALTSGTPIRIDPSTGVANQGTVTALHLSNRRGPVTSIPVGLHPSGMALSRHGKFLYVANANSDTVSVIDTADRRVIETIPCRPMARLPFGSGCNALALSPDGGTLYVANGTNNCVAVVELGKNVSEAAGDRPAGSRVLGLIPTGWYPGALLLSRNGKTLYVANVKGHGSLSRPRPIEKGMNSHDHLGSVSVIPIPDAGQLAAFTERVNRNNRLAYSLAGLDPPRTGIKPVPVPERHGEPSIFKHVIYVIKENRTYDQVFGDVKEGNGDPNLVLFGEEVTPNHHALARQFTLLDNFYCSGVLSADGHTWVNEAYVSDYLEKAFGGFTRSYPDDGSDPLAYVSQGFLWSNALAHNKTLRNYGEYVRNDFVPKTATWTDFYQDFVRGTRKFKAVATANIGALQPYTHTGYPWFPLLMPDVYRAQLFIDELRGFEQKGEFPNLVYVTLPCDHTDGTRPGAPTPRAMVADNDLALGRIVEAVSHSKFWKDSCILVVEDDPQNGFDHVDAHRTVALVVSPYTRRKAVDSTCYNQTGMVKTIELILGLPPMNQLDLSATPMRNAFQTEPDPTPYAARPNRIPLDEMNPAVQKLSGVARHWAEKSLALKLDEGDAADEDTLNRILWFSGRGTAPYPERYAGRKQD